MNPLLRATRQADNLIDVLTRGENVGDATLVEELRSLRTNLDDAATLIRSAPDDEAGSGAAEGCVATMPLAENATLKLKQGSGQVPGEFDDMERAEHAEREVHALLVMATDACLGDEALDEKVLFEYLHLMLRLFKEARAARDASREKLLAALGEARS